MKEESIIYNLPENWAEEAVFSFDHLSELVLQLHDSAICPTPSDKSEEKYAIASHKFNKMTDKKTLQDFLLKEIGK